MPILQVQLLNTEVQVNDEAHEDHEDLKDEDIVETKEEPSITRKDIYILSLIWSITAVSYCLSLDGGDLEYIKENLGKLGRYILISVVFFFVFNVMFYKKCTPLNRTSLRFLQFAILVGTFGLFYLLDHGDTLDHHGSYNLLIFTILFMPAGIVVFTVVTTYGCLTRNGQKYCKRGAFVFLSILLVAMITSLKNNRELFFVGLSGTRMEEKNHVCQPTGWNVPWFDLLPAGANNFWTGSQVCVALPRHYTAHINDTTGHVHVANCSTTPKVTFFPSTKDFAPVNRTYKTMHIAAKELWIEEEMHDVEKGLKIPEGRESLLVECGDQEKQLLHYVQVQKMSSGRAQINDKTAHTSQKAGASDPQDKPNILMIFIDATGRRQFHRRLPKTIKWLEKMKQNSSHSAPMDVLQYFRYHIVGFNTGPNTIAMYCGQNENAPGFHEKAMEDPMCPIWKPYQKEGYSTIVMSNSCEDWSGIFLRNTTSAYINHEVNAPFCHPDYFPYEGNPFGNFKGPYSILRRCLFGDYVHKHTMNYMDQAIRKYTAAEQPYFMVSSFMEAHEGTGEVLATVDDDLSAFLTNLEKDKQLENTIVVIAADHGLHMGINFAFLENGKLEHRFPFLTMLVPSKYNREAIEKLRNNEQKLVTAYDLHHTLLKLPGFRKDGSFEDNVIEKPANISSTTSTQTAELQNTLKPVASSFFDDIPWKRTCEEANISDELCECKFEAKKPSKLAYVVEGLNEDASRLRRE